LDAARLPSLLALLLHQGYDVIGPTVRDGAVVLDTINSIQDLPAGWTDEQSPGHYRLKRQEGPVFFGFGVGPQGCKRYFHPADVKLWSAERQQGTFRILNNGAPPQHPFAFFGIRPCDLAAITLQDRVLAGDKYHDPIYSTRREGAFLLVAQCTHSSATCFCASLGTGPDAKGGFDLALTEITSKRAHEFLIQAGSQRGAKLLAELETSPAAAEVVQESNLAVEAAAREQTRGIDVKAVDGILQRNFDSPQWEKISARCLTCGNCTMVCPTCFCTTVEDASDLTGMHAERHRRWDSCFTLSFSYIHGGSVRGSAKSRYRQWMTHKLSSWKEQFGTLGCVGCGRCITWCPVGIDLTEGVRVLQEGENNGNS
jgi:ferredoxin